MLDQANDAIELRLLGWSREDICQQLNLTLDQLLEIFRACPGLHTMLGITVIPPARQRAPWVRPKRKRKGFAQRMMRLGKKYMSCPNP